MRIFISFLSLCITATFLSYGTPPTQSTTIRSNITPISQTHDLRLDELHELFKILNIKVEKTYEAMNAYAQKHWLRKPGQERWHMKTSEHQPQADKVIQIVKLLGMIDQLDPTIKNPDYAFVLGATVYRMRTRIQHLLDLIEKGHFKPKKIIFLTGERPLDPTQEPETLIMDKNFIRADWKYLGPIPKNESQAAELIWDQLPKPDCIKNIPVMFVATPMQNKNGKAVRPTTTDTIQTWLKTSPKPGSIVAFSNNPYVLYQHETMKPLLIKAGWFKKGGQLETVGSGSSENIEIAPLLDNIARYIYSILQVQQAEQEVRKIR